MERSLNAFDDAIHGGQRALADNAFDLFDEAQDALGELGDIAGHSSKATAVLAGSAGFYRDVEVLFRLENSYNGPPLRRRAVVSIFGSDDHCRNLV